MQAAIHSDMELSTTPHLCSRHVLHAQHSEERKLVWAGSHQLQAMYPTMPLVPARQR